MRLRSSFLFVSSFLLLGASFGVSAAAHAENPHAASSASTSAPLLSSAAVSAGARTPLHTVVSGATSASAIPTASARPLGPMGAVQLRTLAAPTSFYLVDPAASGEPPVLRAPVTGEPALGRSGRWYWPLCTSPCVMDIAPGRYRIAVGDGASEPIEAKGEVALKNETAVVLQHKSRASIRGLGWILGLSGGVAMTLGFRDLTSENTYPTASAAALGVGLLGFASGLIMIAQKDTISVRTGTFEDLKPARTSVGPALPESGRAIGPTWSGRF